MTERWAWHPNARGDAHELRCEGRLVGTTLPFADERFRVEDTIERFEEGAFRWTRVFTMADDADESAPCRLKMEFAPSYEPAYYMIPAVSYHGNGWGKGLEPKGLTREGEPWTYAWHRTSVPGATYSEGGGMSVALFGEAPASFGRGFSCSLAPGPNGGLVHALIWPEEEAPLVYIGRDRYEPAFRRELFLRANDRFEAVAYIVVAPVVSPRTAWRRMLDIAWRQRRETIRARLDAETVWRLGVRYAKEGLWSEDGPFRGFAIGNKWEGGEWVRHRHYEIGWCGQNASFANSLFADYVRTGDEDSRAKAAALLDGWIEAGRLPNGLIHCHYDYVLFMQGEPEVQDACNLGTAAVQLFEAEEWAARCGLERPAYRESALGICDFALRAQSPDGRIGKAWTNDGAVADPNGTVGCFLVPPLVLAYETTGEAAYLQAAEAGYRYYIRELLDDGYTTAGALDTYCVDKESSIPLLKAGIALYRVTNNRTYLDWAEHAAWYLATWQWHHTVPYGEETALGALGYDTFGGTAVSTQHHHLDPYALAFVEDWLALGELTGDRTWTERAAAAWANASIGISDGTLSVMGKPRPAGSQDEGFCHTRWGDPFQVTQWLVAWPTAFRLEALRRLADVPAAAPLWGK